MLRFCLAATGLALAISAAACSHGQDDAATSHANVSARATVPLHCDGLSGIQKLGLVSKGALVGLAEERAYLRVTSGAGAACESRKLDGSDAQPCPSPNAETTAMRLVGEDADFLYFQGDTAIFRTKKADRTSAVLRAGATSDVRLVGDTLLWTTASNDVWSMPKAGGAKTAIAKQSLLDGYAASGDELVTAGTDGLVQMTTTDGFLTVSEAKPVSLPPSFAREEPRVNAVTLSDKTIGFRHADHFWTLDRETSTLNLAFHVLDGTTLSGLEMEADELYTYLEYRPTPKPTQYSYARLGQDTAEMLIRASTPVANVTRHDGHIVWSVEDAAHEKTNQFFMAPDTHFAKGALGQVDTIQCSDQPLAAPVDAGAEPDAAAPAPAEAGAPKPAPKPKNDAGVITGDDDDLGTDTDATEPSNGNNDGELPPTVMINPACQAVPGAASSSFGVVVAMGALALVRRRRRR